MKLNHKQHNHDRIHKPYALLAGRDVEQKEKELIENEEKLSKFSAFQDQT